MLKNQFEIAVSYLMNGYEGDYIEHEDGRRVEIVNMAGGRYLCIDCDGEVARLVDDAAIAYNFLRDKEERK